MSYNRGPSPPTRRADPRFADAMADAYHSHRHNSSVLPRGSNERVSGSAYIPSSSSGSSRSTASGYDSHRSGESSRTSASTRSRPTVVEGAARTTSPVRDGRYHVITTSSRGDRDSRTATKVYNMDSGGARLISETEILPDGSRNERYRSDRYQQALDEERAAHSASRHSGSSRHARAQRSIDDVDGFSYTDAAGMYRDTEPAWRPRELRRRRGSIDRSGSLADYGVDGQTGSRRSRDYGPPPSTRGWDKVNEGIGRTKSMRDGPRVVEQSPHRGREQRESREHHAAPRHESNERRSNRIERYNDKYDPYESDDHVRTQNRERRLSAHKPKDRSVSRRGFGIRSDSQERRANRHSDESLDDYRQDDFAAPRRDYTSDTEHISKRHSKQHDLRREREYSPGEDRERRYREDSEPRERHHREHSREHGAGAAAAAGGLAAAGAALYGLSSKHADDDREHKRRSDDSRTRHSETLDHEPDSRRPAHAPYPGDDDAQGLGFSFEGGHAIPDRTRAKHDSSREASQDNRRMTERAHEDVPPALSGDAPLDPDEEYRRRIQQAQRDLGYTPSAASDDAERERRRRERESRMQHRREHLSSADTIGGASSADRSPMRESFDLGRPTSSSSDVHPTPRPDMQRRGSVIDDPMPPDMGAVILDNSQSEHRETRVRIVDPPTEEEEKKPKGILKRPTQKFPEDLNVIREGVAPLKDANKKGIPAGARWTKIDRRLVNPQALEEAKERYEERLDCVIVLRVLTKEEIQKLADKTKAIRGMRDQGHISHMQQDVPRLNDSGASECETTSTSTVAWTEDEVEDPGTDEHFSTFLRRTFTTIAANLLTEFATERRFSSEDKRSSQREDRHRDRRDRDEYSDESGDEWDRDKRPVRMLEAPASATDHDRRS